MEAAPDGSFRYTSKRRRDDHGLDSLREDSLHESKVWKCPYFHLVCRFRQLYTVLTIATESSFNAVPYLSSA